ARNVAAATLQNVAPVTPLSQLERGRGTGLALTTLGRTDRERLTQNVGQVRALSQQRQEAEAKLLASGAPLRSGDPPRPLRLALPQKTTAPTGPANQTGTPPKVDPAQPKVQTAPKSGTPPKVEKGPAPTRTQPAQTPPSAAPPKVQTAPSAPPAPAKVQSSP